MASKVCIRCGGECGEDNNCFDYWCLTAESDEQEKAKKCLRCGGECGEDNNCVDYWCLTAESDKQEKAELDE